MIESKDSKLPDRHEVSNSKSKVHDELHDAHVAEDLNERSFPTGDSKNNEMNDS